MSIQVRKVEDEDKWVVYEWANDKDTRYNSFNSKIITEEEHSAWFDSATSDPGKIILICLWEGQRAAIVRFQDQDDYALIGINTNPFFRGKKLSHVFIKEAVKLYQEQRTLPVKAMIKPSNISSIKSFLKAGFIPLPDEVVASDYAKVFLFEK